MACMRWMAVDVDRGKEKGRRLHDEALKAGGAILTEIFHCCSCAVLLRA